MRSNFFVVQRLSLAIWTIIGMMLLASFWLLDTQHLLTAVLSGDPIKITIQDASVAGGESVPGGKIDVQVILEGQTEAVQTIYADFREIGGYRVDLRKSDSNSYIRQHIPIPATVETGTYLIPVRVILTNAVQKEQSLTLTVTDAPLREAAPEVETPTPVEEAPTMEATPEPAPSIEEEPLSAKGVISVVAPDTLQVFFTTPLHPNGITASGEQFSIHEFSNYFSEVPVEKVMLNSSGEVLTIKAKGLKKGSHYALAMPDGTVKSLQGADLTLTGPISFEYREVPALSFHMSTAIQKTHKTVEVSFTRALDMDSFFQAEPVCQLWSPKYQRNVGASTHITARTDKTIVVEMDHSIPVGSLEMTCSNLIGSFGAQPIARVLRQPLQIPTAKSDIRQVIYRSDFNRDGTINEEDAAALIEAMHMGR